MKEKDIKVAFGCCSVFGFEPVSENNSDSRKVLTHFNGGFKLNYTHDEDCSDIERIQSNLL